MNSIKHEMHVLQALFRGAVTVKYSRHKYAIKSKYNESVPLSLYALNASQVGLITHRSFHRNRRFSIGVLLSPRNEYVML